MKRFRSDTGPLRFGENSQVCPCGAQHSGWLGVAGRGYLSRLCQRCAAPRIALLRELTGRLAVMPVQPVFHTRTSPTVGECPLTPRELDAVRGLATGKTYKEIARAEGVATSTIRTYLHSAYAKLGVTDRAQAVLTVHRNGWFGEAPGALDAVPDVDAAEPELTDTQRDYLTSFERFLRTAPGSIEERAARRAMSERFEVVLDEASTREGSKRMAA